MPIQSRAIIAGVFFLASLSGRGLGQPTDAATGWEVKQLATEQEYGDVGLYVRSGSKLRLKRKVASHIQLPKWSPDGRYLAFLTDCYSVRCLEITKATGGWHPVRLTDFPNKVFKDWTSTVNFAWSPTGNEIAYLDETDHGPSIISLVKLDGSGRRELQRLPCRYPDVTLEWSPDGQKLVFHDCADGIVAFDRSSGDARVIARGTRPRWSPDGKMLVFRKAHVSIKGREVLILDGALWVVNADGTQERHVLEGDLADFGLTWLPSGNGIVFGSTRDNNEFAEIFRINVDGTGLKKVASGARQRLSLASPVFSPDERQLLVVGSSGGILDPPRSPRPHRNGRFFDDRKLQPIDMCLQCSLDFTDSTLPPHKLTLSHHRFTFQDRSPRVILFDLAAGRQKKMADGYKLNAIWGHK